MFLLILIITCSILYIYTLDRIYTHGQKISAYNTDYQQYRQNISIIIPARNEENTILDCVRSILENNYVSGDFEILVIDDHSEDNTCEVVKNLDTDHVKVLALPPDMFGKKAAITYGTATALHPVILSTDADCVVSSQWIMSHATMYQDSEVQMCTASVLPEDDKTILSTFQFFDFASTMMTTAAGFYTKQYYLANGANMSFRKSAFQRVSGYDDNHTISSGDDVFLIGQISKAYPRGVRFIQERGAFVTTKPESSWKSLFEQRWRWASKASKSNNPQLMILQGFIFFYASILMIGVILGIILSSPAIFLYASIGILIKLIIDLVYLTALCRYFQKKFYFWTFLPSYFIYFIHIIGSGFGALFPTKYVWKGRKVR